MTALLSQKSESSEAEGPAVALRPRQILFVNTWSSCHGGTSTSLLDIVSNISREQFVPSVLCPTAGPLTDRLQNLGIPVFHHGLSPLSCGHLGAFVRETAWYFRFLREHNVDLVHSNTSCWRRSVAFAAYLRGIPFIQHVRNPLSNFETDFAFRIARRIITNSHAVAEPLLKDSRFRDKTLTLYNAVDLARYRDLRDCRHELEMGDGPVIGFVGQLVPRKGLHTLIEALPKIRDRFPRALLTIVGCSPPGNDAYEKECLGLAQSLQVEGSVRFVGYRQDIPAWMRTFDVFVLPTQSEPFGKVIIEAMAAECPVVSTSVGGIPEIIRDASLGTLVQPDDSAATADAVITYLSEPELARRVGKAGCDHVHQHFSLTGMIASLEGLYADVLAERPGKMESSRKMI